MNWKIGVDVCNLLRKSSVHGAVFISNIDCLGLFSFEKGERERLNNLKAVLTMLLV